MRLLIVLAGFVCYTQAFMFAGNREDLNQNATLVCFKGENCTMEIRISSTDRVDLVYYESPSNNIINSIGVEDSKPTGTTITGTGTTEDPWLLRLEMACNNIDVTLPDPNDALLEAEGLVVNASVMVKYYYERAGDERIVFVQDVRYQPSCDFAAAVAETVVSSVLAGVSGGSDEAITAESDTAVLEAYNTVNPDFPAIILNLGEDMYWQASIANPTTSIAKGLYLYNCDLCDTNVCDDVVVNLVDANGCTKIPPITAFTDPGNTGISKTGTFEAVKLSGKDFLFLRCSVGFCYSTEPRCSDYCASNAGRKKRAVEEEEKIRVVLGKVTIGVDSTGNTTRVSVVGQPENHSEKNSDSEKYTGLMVAVISLSALLVIGLFTAVAVFVRLSARNNKTPHKA